jgi:chromate reductase
MKIFMMAASTRKDSVNKKLIHQAAQYAQTQSGIEIDFAEFNDFELPLYDGDLNVAIGLPPKATEFINRINSADAIIISSPEYNFSIPGTLKNLIDWVSRASPMPWTGKQILLMSASPSLVGGNRGLWHTRVPLECCGAFVFPDMFSLSSAYSAFKENGELQDAALQKRLHTNIQAFLDYLRI